MKPPAERRLLLRVAQVVLIVGALVLAGRQVAQHWDEFRRTAGSLRPSLAPLLGSVAAVLALYAVQIHSWRVLVSAWGGHLRFWTAARIWTVQSLARFLPASQLFTTGAMAVLAARAGVSPVTAAGSAILGTLLNLGTGFVVLALTGSGLLRSLDPRLATWLAPMLAVVGGVGLLMLPLAIAPLTRVASRWLGRPLDLPPVPLGALAVAVTANVVAWLLYGVSFRWLTLAFFPGSGSNLVAYVTVFTAGYLAGWLALPVPAGFGIREGTLMLLMPAAQVTTTAQAAVVIVASRLMLTILESVPGALFIARGAASRSSDTP